MRPNGVRDLEQGVREPAWRSVLSLASALGVDCTAFTQPPAQREPPAPGRPRKLKEGTQEVKPKRARGRPRKDSG
jgi:hypothetical protein